MITIPKYSDMNDTKKVPVLMDDYFDKDSVFTVKPF